MMSAARQLTAMIGPFVFDEGIDGSTDPSTARKWLLPFTRRRSSSGEAASAPMRTGRIFLEFEPP